MKKRNLVTGLVVLAMTAMLSGCGKKIERVETARGEVQYQYDAVDEDSVRVIYSDGSKKSVSELDDYMFNRPDYAKDLTVYVEGQGTFDVEMRNYVKADEVIWRYNGIEGLLPGNIPMGSVDPSAFSYEFVYSDGFNISGVPKRVELSADGDNVMSEITLKNGVTQKVLWGYDSYAADVQPIDQGTLGNVDGASSNSSGEAFEVQELTFNEFEAMVRNNILYGESYNIFDTSGMEFSLNCPGKVFRAKTNSNVEYNSSYYVDYCIFSDAQEAKEACERLYERRKELDSKVSGTESCFITLNDNNSSHIATRKGNIVMSGYAVNFENIYSGCGSIMEVFGFETANLE